MKIFQQPYKLRVKAIEKATPNPEGMYKADHAICSPVGSIHNSILISGNDATLA